MKECIEREAALKAFEPQYGDWSECWSAEEIKPKLESIPAADVVEVIHAHWVECGDNQPVSSDKVYCCSNCKGNKRLKHQFKPFCELCGAKMDGGMGE